MRFGKVVLGIVMVGALGLFAGCGTGIPGDGTENDAVITEVPEMDEMMQSRQETTVQDGQAMPTPDAPILTETPQTDDRQEDTMAVTEPVYGEVPLVFIETENRTGVTDNETYTNCTVSVTNCEAEYELSGKTAGIRLRGNSTQMYEKKPYRIKFEEKQQLLGLSEGAHKSWVLLAEFNDPTLLRNLITYRLANKLDGISYATDCALVEVYLDGEYIGVYLLAEQTQVDGDRIALDECGVTDGTVTDTGYLLELEADITRRNEEGAEGEAWFAVTGYASETDNSMQMLLERTFDESAAYYVIKSDARSAEQVKFIQNYMIQVYDAVYQDKTKEAVEALVDLPSAVDMYLVQLIANDYDNNYSSVYVYKDAGGKLMFGAPWDFDLAYGNFNGYTEAEDTIYIYHLLRKLGEYDWFKEMLAKRYTEISEGENSLLAELRATVTELTEQYAGAFEREYARWRNDLIGMGAFGGNGAMGGFGNWGDWGDWEMPEGTEDFGNWGNWGDFGAWGEMPQPEGGENFENPGKVPQPEGEEGFGGFGAWGNWEMPEGTEDFGNWGNWGEWKMPQGAEGFGSWGDWGGMGNFSYGAVYDTHGEAAEALLVWLDARLAWIETYLLGEEDAA